MNTDLFLIIAASLLILGMGLLATWHHVRRQGERLKRLEDELEKKLAFRRDTIPYLIENYRLVIAAPSEPIQSIIQKRATARQTRQLKPLWEIEKELEVVLETLFKEERLSPELAKDIGWVEARTEIQEAIDEVNTQEEAYIGQCTRLAQKVEKFPFFLFKKSVAKLL